MQHLDERLLLLPKVQELPMRLNTSSFLTSYFLSRKVMILGDNVIDVVCWHLFLTRRKDLVSFQFQERCVVSRFMAVMMMMIMDMVWYPLLQPEPSHVSLRYGIVESRNTGPIDF